MNDLIAQRFVRQFAAILTLFAATHVLAADRVFRNGFDPGIEAPAETWTWVPFPESQCGDGSSTGIGVNLTSASDSLLIYLQEGGACWDYATCYLLQTADNFGGYGEAQFATDVADTTYIALPGGFFDRAAAANPFKDYSWAFVPYCTGDIHAGDNVAQLKFLGSTNTAHFVGYANLRTFLYRLAANLRTFLYRLAATFPNATRIVLAGSSAGGFGSALNWSQTAEAFPGVRVDMIDDSGAIMPNDVLGSTSVADEQAQRTNWNLAATTPAGCTGCAAAFDAIYDFDSAAFPDSRGALLSYVQDSTLPSFYAITTSKFSQGLFETETQLFDPTSNLRYFNAGGSGHVLWFSPSLTTKTTSILQFVTMMVEDDPGWNSVSP